MVDGGSKDRTREIADQSGAELLTAPPNRGAQMRAGAHAARHPWLLFLNADTVLDAGWEREAAHFMERVDSGRSRHAAAAFRFALDDDGICPARARGPCASALRHAAPTLRRAGTAYRAQSAYDKAGGHRAVPLMEDVDLVRRIGLRRVKLLRSRAVSNAARYRRDGYHPVRARQPGAAHPLQRCILPRRAPRSSQAATSKIATRPPRTVVILPLDFGVLVLDQRFTGVKSCACPVRSSCISAIAATCRAPAPPQADRPRRIDPPNRHRQGNREQGRPGEAIACRASARCRSTAQCLSSAPACPPSKPSTSSRRSRRAASAATGWLRCSSGRVRPAAARSPKCSSGFQACTSNALLHRATSRQSEVCGPASTWSGSAVSKVSGFEDFIPQRGGHPILTVVALHRS